MNDLDWVCCLQMETVKDRQDTLDHWQTQPVDRVRKHSSNKRGTAHTQPSM